MGPYLHTTDSDMHYGPLPTGYKPRHALLAPTYRLQTPTCTTGPYLRSTVPGNITYTLKHKHANTQKYSKRLANNE